VSKTRHIRLAVVGVLISSCSSVPLLG
jgi:hypothetical protein